MQQYLCLSIQWFEGSDVPGHYVLGSSSMKMRDGSVDDQSCNTQASGVGVDGRRVSSVNAQESLSRCFGDNL